MNLKWTKADEKRAARMGWRLVSYGQIWRNGDRFKTEQEAARWIVNHIIGSSYVPGPRHSLGEREWETCRKAILICCGA